MVTPKVSPVKSSNVAKRRQSEKRLVTSKQIET